jgi:hypothetical protein
MARDCRTEELTVDLVVTYNSHLTCCKNLTLRHAAMCPCGHARSQVSTSLEAGHAVNELLRCSKF